MLPAPLVRARARGPSLQPLRADAHDPLVRDLVSRIHDGFAAGAASHARLGDVLSDLDEVVADAPDIKLARGLIRTAEQRCETAASEIEALGVFRRAVFVRAAAVGPLGLTDGGRPTAADVLAEVAVEHGLDPRRAADDLYADLPLERRVASYDVREPDHLVERYDVSLVQSLLATANDIQVTLDGPSMPRMRQLVRWIKFFRLLHRAHLDGDRLELTLDGPLSIFGPSSRYGTALASFFPALLLQECPWTLTAAVAWRRGPAKQLVVRSGDGYVSHFADTGAYRTRVHEHFTARFAEGEREFTLGEGTLPIAIAERDLVFPDFTLTHPTGATVHLEIVGYWRPERLVQRLDALTRSGVKNLVVAVGRKLASGGRPELPEHPQLVAYSELLSVERVLSAARRCIER